MNKIDVDLVKEAGNYVTKLLAEKLPDSIEFHTIDHAKCVVDNAEFIGKNSGLTDGEINIVKLCAWFHDVGYIVKPEGHEEESAKIAAEFLNLKGIEEATTTLVKNCILATIVPQQPKDLISKVLCDADLIHLSKDNYFERIEKMRKEWINLSEKKIGKRKFHATSVKFFQMHKYHTDFAKKELQPKKEKNLQLIQKEIYMLEQEKEKE